MQSCPPEMQQLMMAQLSGGGAAAANNPLIHSMLQAQQQQAVQQQLAAAAAAGGVNPAALMAMMMPPNSQVSNIHLLLRNQSFLSRLHKRNLRSEKVRCEIYRITKRRTPKNKTYFQANVNSDMMRRLQQEGFQNAALRH